MQDLLDNINQPMTRGKQIIAPVHFAGIPVDMQTLDRSIAGINTVVIEDAAHAIGSCYLDGTRVGSSAYSDMTIFSFHPPKTITTGEGGMVTTNNEHYYRMLKLFRNNGIEREQPFLTGTAAPWYYEAQALTGNFNFTDFQAALGLSQLRRIPQFVAKRKKLMETYRELLKGYDHIRLLMPQQEHVAHHLCVVEINIKALKTTRTAIMEKLKERGIGSQYHYIPIYRHPSIASLVGDIAEYFPQMEKYYPQALSLPLYFDLTEDDVEYVVKNLLEITK
jgi:dTDP-4-amino-4,6-dideoxygalactose transaminase